MIHIGKGKKVLDEETISTDLPSSIDSCITASVYVPSPGSTLLFKSMNHLLVHDIHFR